MPISGPSRCTVTTASNIGTLIYCPQAILGGDGFHEVHVNTMEGFWSLLRSWLRPHRGISQEKLPIYLGFFQFVHNTRKRGKALLGALVGALVAPRGSAASTPKPRCYGALGGQ